jgi:predicted nucleic acid-binding protein
VIVYLETNGILDVALHQERSAQTGQLLSMAADGAIQMYVPAVALAESYYPLRKRTQEFAEYQRMNKRIAEQMNRSSAEEYRFIVRAGSDLEIRLGALLEHERASLRECIVRLSRHAHDIPLSVEVIHGAFELMSSADLTEFDAMICSSILQHAAGAPSDAHKAFLSYDEELAGKAENELRRAGVVTFSDPEKCAAYAQRFAGQ